MEAGANRLPVGVEGRWPLLLWSRIAEGGAGRMAANIPSRPILGIGWMLLGGLVMTVNNAILKWLSVGYPAGQIMFIRSVFILLPIAYFIARSGGFLSIRVRRVHMHVVWSGCMILSTVIYIAGLPYLPLADVTAIGF